MRRIQFKQLRLRNIKAFVEPAKLSLVSPGVSFVKGRNLISPRLQSNGASKSSLWDVLTWTLFGRTASGLRNTDLRPWYGSAGASLGVLDFIVDEEAHSISRSISPNRLLLDDRVVDQTAIDSLLGLSFDIFVQTVVLGQGRPLFFDLAPREKLDLFTSVLNLDRWERRSTIANELAVGMNRELDKKNNAVAILESRIAQFDDLIGPLSIDRKNWEKDFAARSLEAENRRKDLDNKLAALQKKRDEADLSYDSAGTELRASRLEKIQLEEYLRISREQETREVLKLEQLRREIERAKKELDTLGQDGVCPTCGQSVKGTQLEKHRSEIKAEVAGKKKLVAAGISKALESQLKDLRAQLERNVSSSRKLQAKADAANDVMIAVDPQISDVKAEIAQLTRNRNERDKELNPFTDQLKDLRRKRAAAESSIEAEKKEAVKLERVVNRTGFWIKGFKEVRLYMIEEVLHDLELATNAMLEEFGLLGWSVSYNIERETQSGSVSRALNVAIMSPQNSKPVRFESWSGGEGQRLRLISALALSDVLLVHAGVETSLEVLDEPTRGLSMAGIDDLVDCLVERAKQRQSSIFFTDHRVLESSRFSSTLLVTKDKTGAHLSWD